MDSSLPLTVNIKKNRSLDLKDFNKFYLSQGFSRKGKSTNDCGPACVAMILNILLDQNELAGRKVTKAEVIENMTFYGRLPGWIPSIGGATAPWGMVSAFNQLVQDYKIPWQARRISCATRIQIRNYLKQGNLVSFLRFWKQGGAHWSNFVDLSADGKRFSILDPDPGLNERSVVEKVLVREFPKIRSDWNRQPWWAVILGLKREIVVYEKN